MAILFTKVTTKEEEQMAQKIWGDKFGTSTEKTKKVVELTEGQVKVAIAVAMPKSCKAESYKTYKAMKSKYRNAVKKQLGVFYLPDEAYELINASWEKRYPYNDAWSRSTNK